MQLQTAVEGNSVIHCRRFTCYSPRTTDWQREWFLAAGTWC